MLGNVPFSYIFWETLWRNKSLVSLKCSSNKIKGQVIHLLCFTKQHFLGCCLNIEAILVVSLNLPSLYKHLCKLKSLFFKICKEKWTLCQKYMQLIQSLQEVKCIVFRVRTATQTVLRRVKLRLNFNDQKLPLMFIKVFGCVCIQLVLKHRF